MHNKKVPKRLIKETKMIFMLYRFLHHDCGLKFADKLSAKELKGLFNAFQNKSKNIPRNK